MKTQLILNFFNTSSLEQKSLLQRPIFYLKIMQPIVLFNALHVYLFLQLANDKRTGRRFNNFDAIIIGSALHTLSRFKEAAKYHSTVKWEDMAMKSYKNDMGSLIRVILVSYLATV